MDDGWQFGGLGWGYVFRFVTEKRAEGTRSIYFASMIPHLKFCTVLEKKFRNAPDQIYNALKIRLCSFQLYTLSLRSCVFSRGIVRCKASSQAALLLCRLIHVLGYRHVAEHMTRLIRLLHAGTLTS
jgi:hypothetical protein